MMYKIQERKWSTNAIVDDNGKFILTVALPKEQGDVMVNVILEYLNSQQGRVALALEQL